MGHRMSGVGIACWAYRPDHTGQRRRYLDLTTSSRKIERGVSYEYRKCLIS